MNMDGFIATAILLLLALLLTGIASVEGGNDED